MASSTRAATVIALAVILAPAISQSGTADTNVNLAYLPWATPSQPWINGDVLPAGGRHPRHKPYVPAPRRWRNALCVPADQKGIGTGSTIRA
jgi:hypothetical protein